jgi:hypothetical protein
MDDSAMRPSSLNTDASITSSSLSYQVLYGAHRVGLMNVVGCTSLKLVL